MADKRITRRELVPGIAAGTAAVASTLAAQPAAAARVRRVTSTAGPCGLWRGHSIRYQFFLPAVQRGGNQASQFRLVIQDLEGNEIATHDFELLPGKGKEVEAQAQITLALPKNPDSHDDSLLEIKKCLQALGKILESL